MCHACTEEASSEGEPEVAADDDERRVVGADEAPRVRRPRAVHGRRRARARRGTALRRRRGEGLLRGNPLGSAVGLLAGGKGFRLGHGAIVAYLAARSASASWAHGRASRMATLSREGCTRFVSSATTISRVGIDPDARPREAEVSEGARAEHRSRRRAPPRACRRSRRAACLPARSRTSHVELSFERRRAPVQARRGRPRRSGAPRRRRRRAPRAPHAPVGASAHAFSSCTRPTITPPRHGTSSVGAAIDRRSLPRASSCRALPSCPSRPSGAITCSSMTSSGSVAPSKRARASPARR